MGCCEGTGRTVPKSSVVTADTSQIVDEPKRLYNIQLMNEVENLVEAYKSLDWARVYTFVDRQDQVDIHSVDLEIQLNENPKRVGGLAFCLLLAALNTNPGDICEVLANDSRKLVQSLKMNPEIRKYTIVFLTKLLDDEDLEPLTEELKAKLADEGIFESLIALFRVENYQIRISCAQLASLVYRYSTARQEMFFLRQGHHNLVQLIKRDEENDDSLIEILNAILDLVYVISRQDNNGMPNQEFITKLAETHIVDIVREINVQDVIYRQRSSDLLEKIDEIMALRIQD